MLDNSAVRSLTLDEVLEEFHIPFRPKGPSAATFDRYQSPVDTFATYLKERSVERPGEVTCERVNLFLDQMRQRRRAAAQGPLADATAHFLARGTNSLLKFWYSEGYLTSPIAVPIPHSDQKFPLFLSQDHVRTIVGRCPSRRVEALLLLAASKGRRKGTARSSSIKIIRPTCAPPMEQWDLEILINVLERILRNQLARSDPPASHNDPGQNST